MADLDQHMADRDALVRAEEALRFDTGLYRAANRDEKTATRIVDNIREKEAKRTWKAADNTLSYPGIRFLTTKDIIAKTELFKIIQKMPKGGLLRAHLNTMCDPQVVYNLARKYPKIMHIKVDSEFSPDPREAKPAPAFKPFPDKTAAYVNGPTLTDPGYTSGTWVPFDKARAEFKYGGPSGFDKWILESMRLSTKEGRGNRAPFRAWEKLRVAYRAAGGIISYEPIMRQFLRQALLSWVDDGISYSEIRVLFPSLRCIREDGDAMLHSDFVKLFGEIVDEVKNTRKDEFVGAKIIYVALRSENLEDLHKSLHECKTLKKHFPNHIAGFDFLGPEDPTAPFSPHQIDALLNFQQETRRAIPFLFLVGETTENGATADSNIYDVLLLNTKRIGHALNVVKHPILMDILKGKPAGKPTAQKIAVEACPTANDILGLASAAHHPLRILLNNDIPVVLCSDNPGVFRNSGLSFDFYQVIAGSFDIDLLSLKLLARNSLEYSMLNEVDKREAIAAWEARWKLFVDDLNDKKLASLRGRL